jgi:hypothetical protein
VSYQGLAHGAGAQQGQRARKTYSGTITGAVTHGGLIQLTSNGHKLNTGDHITVTGVVGTVEANAAWVITRTGGNNFDLNGSTFTNAYVSGGSFKRG